MANMNLVVLIGNMTRDVSLRFTPSQTPVGEFGLAINRKWRTPDGQAKEEVCFVDCVAFGKSAETLAKYVAKGSPLAVTGRLQFQSWVGKDGQKRNRLKVVVEQFQFIGGKAEARDESQAQAEPERGPEPPVDDDPTIPF